MRLIWIRRGGVGADDVDWLTVWVVALEWDPEVDWLMVWVVALDWDPEVGWLDLVRLAGGSSSSLLMLWMLCWTIRGLPRPLRGGGGGAGKETEG